MNERRPSSYPSFRAPRISSELRRNLFYPCFLLGGHNKSSFAGSDWWTPERPAYRPGDETDNSPLPARPQKLIAQRRILGAQKLQILFIRKGRTLHEQVDNIHDNSSTSLYSVTTVYLTFLLYYIARLVTRWVWKNAPSWQVRSIPIYFICYGEVAEWFKAPVLKTGDPARDRGFESHPLRH